MVTYHERAKRIVAAISKKEAKRAKILEQAKGTDGLSLEEQFTYEDLDAASKAVREVLSEEPGIKMAALQDLAGERALVREDVVVAAIWEEVGKGNLKLIPGLGVELTANGREID